MSHVQDDSKKKVQAAFIDFPKAFVSVWHDCLFEKLSQKRIDQKFWELVQCMYLKTECAVKLNNWCTSFFQCSKGVHQGCPLSPTLFDLFINNLVDELNDYLIIFSSSGKDYRSASTTGLIIVITGNLKWKYKRSFNINITLLHNVTEFTYLRITLNAACNFKKRLNILSSKANRALLAFL